MILLITPSNRMKNAVGKALGEALSEPVHVAESLSQALIQLRQQDYSAVVLDQSLTAAEPDESEIVLPQMGTAILVQVNFAISGLERVVRELRAAFDRRQREQRVARQAAEQTLCSEFRGMMTAILLSCELAVQVPDLRAPAAEKMRRLHRLATEWATRLATESAFSSYFPSFLGVVARPPRRSPPDARPQGSNSKQLATSIATRSQ